MGLFNNNIGKLTIVLTATQFAKIVSNIRYSNGLCEQGKPKLIKSWKQINGALIKILL